MMKVWEETVMKKLTGVKMKQFRPLLLPVCLVLLTALVGGCDLDQAIQGPNTSEETVVYDTAPFNLSTQKLPQNYNGHDIEKVHTDLLRVPEKDEFETTEAYKKRLQAAAPPGLYAFRDELVYSEYDADTEMLEIPLYLKTAHVTDKACTVAGIITKRIENPVKKYTGKTAFGVEVEVEKHSGEEYGLAFGSDSVGGYDSDFGVIKIRLAPDAAKSQKSNLAMIYVCKIRASDDALIFAFFDFELQTANISNPVEEDYTQNYVFADLQEIWVYDYLTGQILSKTKAPKPRPYSY